MIPKSEQTLWASQEAAIKAEINQAKNTFDLVRMAKAIVRLDALHAEMEAAGQLGSRSPSTPNEPQNASGWGKCGVAARVSYGPGPSTFPPEARNVTVRRQRKPSRPRKSSQRPYQNKAQKKYDHG